MKATYAYISVQINTPFVEVPCSFFGDPWKLLGSPNVAQMEKMDEEERGWKDQAPR